MKYILGFLLVLFASYADIFLFRINIVPRPPSEFLIPLFIILGFIRYSIVDLYDITKTHTFKLLAFIIFISMVFAAFSNASSDVIITEIALNFITLFLYVIAVQFFRTENKSLVTAVVVMGLLVSGGSVMYDFLVGLPSYSLKLANSVRKGGFGENPNQAASGIKFIALAALVNLTETKILKSVVITFLLIAVFLTFSRSGLVSVFFILVFGAMNNWSNKFPKDPSVLVQNSFKLILLFAVLYISLIAFSNVIRTNFPQFTRGEAGKRLDLLSGKSDKSNISSDAIEGGRADLVFVYIDEFMQNPFGYGTGYTSDKKANGDKLNTHNYYLYLAVNFGYIAFIVYLIYIAYNVRLAFKHNQFYYLIFTILFFLEGFFTHTIFHERPIVLSLAFFDSIIYRKSLNSSNISKTITQ